MYTNTLTLLVETPDYIHKFLCDLLSMLIIPILLHVFISVTPTERIVCDEAC